MKIDRKPLWAALLFLAAALVVPSSVQSQSATLVVLRTAAFDGPYKYAQVVHERGRFVLADVGYIDFDRPGQYLELWAGAGGYPLQGESGSLITQANLVKVFGDSANDQLYLQFLVLGTWRPAENWSSEFAYLPYIPLNDAGETQHLLERAKLEYQMGRFEVGAGYAAYKFGEGDWAHKPFLTTTFQAGSFGSFEFWAQRLPQDDVSLQIRFVKVFVR